MNIYKGNIITCDKNNNVYKYLVEDKGKICFTGDNLPEIYNNKKITDLGNKSLIPSFADSHLHFSSFALFAGTLDIRNGGSFEEIGSMIKEYARKNKSKFILSFGASAYTVKEKKLITREELDKILPDKPIMIVKYDGHASINNSAMINILPPEISKMRGFDKDSGLFSQEAYFTAINFITNKISPITLISNMLKGIDKLADYGIGLIHTVEGVGFKNDIDIDLSRFFSGGLKNPFQVRLFFQTMDTSKVIKRKLPRIGGCFATALDGCFGSLDAALIEPYNNNANNKGVLFYTDKQVEQFVKEANRKELQISVHAIGDAAFNQAVNAFEKALADYPRKDHRHVIIHACLPTKEGLEKCAKLGITIALQPGFLYWNCEPLEYVESILGKRAYDISPLKDMIDMGLILSGGSDAPCTIPDPIEGIYCACNHYIDSQSISIMDALKMYTYNAYWTTFDEADRGSLETGKIADMIILNENPLTMDRKNLRNLKVEKLFLSGKLYKNGQKLLSLPFNNLKRIFIKKKI